MRLREWKRCTDPLAMLRDVTVGVYLPQGEFPTRHRLATLRRLRVFTLLAANPVLERVGHPVYNAAAEVGWRLAEGNASPDELAATDDALRVTWEEDREIDRQHFVAPQDLLTRRRLVNVLILLFREPEGAARHLIDPFALTSPDHPIPLLTPAEVQNCGGLLREVFGDRGTSPPFLSWEPDWLTDTAVTLARQMYDSREFSAMPILADALSGRRVQ